VRWANDARRVLIVPAFTKYSPIDRALEGGIVDRQLLAFMNREINTVCATVMMSRQETDKGTDYITIKDAEELLQLFELWRSTHPKKARDKPPKHTGGKKPYLMVMLERLRELKGGKVEHLPELTGSLVLLGDNIEWGTGRLVRGRGKHKKPMRYGDIQNLLGYSEWKLNKVLALMKEHDLLTETEEGYFVSRQLIRRGGKVQEGGARDA
jgi:hypothetical protein